MLKDAARDEFNIIFAWREDRLYPGSRSMLTVLETVQDYEIEILLAKDYFDSKITPGRAWVAQNDSFNTPCLSHVPRMSLAFNVLSLVERLGCFY